MLRTSTRCLRPLFAGRTYTRPHCVQQHWLTLSTLPQRCLSLTAPRRTSIPPPEEPAPSAQLNSTEIYVGPLGKAFKRLKIFSFTSLGLATIVSPLIIFVESSLPTSARFILAFSALGTSGISSAIISWIAKPYVVTMRRIPLPNGSAVELTTYSLFLKPRITTVHDTEFLVNTHRPFALWELAPSVILPPESEKPAPGHEETVAETKDAEGKVLGSWVVRWSDNGEGACHAVGKVQRHFGVHGELLAPQS